MPAILRGAEGRLRRLAMLQVSMVRGALIGLCLSLGLCWGQEVQVTAVDRTIVPLGATMIFSGQGLTNATDVIIHWFHFEHPAAFSVVSNENLAVTMPTVRQDVRAHYMSVRTPQGSTVGLPPNTYDYMPSDPTIPTWPTDAIVVHPGATLNLSSAPGRGLVYVKSGGVLAITGVLAATIVFAEDGAVVDITGVTEAMDGAFYLSPETVFLGGVPGGNVSVTELTPISASPGIEMFYIGRELELSATGPGTVSVDPQMAYYPYNTLLTMTAEPASNGYFLAWSGDISSTLISVSARIQNDMAVTAAFASGWQLSRHVGGSGSVDVSPDLSCYPDGSVVTLTAHPDAGHKFVAWGGDVTGSNTSTTVTMTKHRRFLAAFRSDEDLRPRITSVDRTVVPVGERMIFTGRGLTNATDVIVHWLEFEHAAPFMILSNADLAVTMPTVRQDGRAHYASVRTPQGSTVGLPPETYEFSTVGPLPQSVSAKAVRVTAGAVLTYDGVAADKLVYVESGGVLACSGDIGASSLVFAEDGALLDFTGIATSMGGVFYVSPDTVLVGTVPTNDFGESSAVIGLPSIAPSPDIATFYVGRQLDVTVIGPGAVAVDPQMEYYPYNLLLTFTAHPASNGVFVSWSGDVSSASASVSARIREDMSITAIFTDGWQLSRHVGGHGSVDVSPDLSCYPDGTVVTLTAHPEAGHQFVAWGGDATGSNTSTTVTMTDHKRFVAAFRADDYGLGPRITAIEPSVVPVGDTMLVSGERLTNATDVIVHWMIFEHPAVFAPGTNGALVVTMPAVRQDVRAHFLSVRAPQGSTVALPSQTYERSGTGPLPDLHAYDAIRVKAGGVLSYDTDAAGKLVYVEAGGVLECSGEVMSPVVFAEDGALLDLTGVTSVMGGVFYVSPDTVVVGAMPTNGFGEGGALTELTSISASAGIAMIHVGFPLSVTAEGPGSVNAIPDKVLYSYNENVGLTATPDTDCFFVRWMGDAQGVETETTVRVRHGAAVTARFSATPDYFRTWRPTYFTPEELADLAICGPDADPDHDGYTNAAEYLFGSNPRVSEDLRRVHVLIEEVNGEPCIFVQYVRPTMAADAQYHVEVSQDLVTWAHNGDGSETVYSRESAHEVIEDGLERVTVQLLPGVALPNSAFSRINATLFE